jgi:hypothetical protein
MKKPGGELSPLVFLEKDIFDIETLEQRYFVGSKSS